MEHYRIHVIGLHSEYSVLQRIWNLAVLIELVPWYWRSRNVSRL